VENKTREDFLNSWTDPFSTSFSFQYNLSNESQQDGLNYGENLGREIFP
jgi:hypothetical protein